MQAQRRLAALPKTVAPGVLAALLASCDRASGITTRIAVEWAVLPGRASRWWWQQRLSVVRGFARYLQAFDPDTEIPPPGLIYSPAPRVTPYVFSDARTSTPASRLDFADLDAPLIGAFLDHLERERGTGTRTRDARLAATRAGRRSRVMRSLRVDAKIVRR